MGQTLNVMWDRARGKWHLERICDKVFDQYKVQDKLAVSDLHSATLMVYINVNKQLFTPYKEPPSKTTVEEKAKDLVSKGTASIDRKQFFDIIMAWIHRDMQIMLINRVILALVAAPGMAVMTKNGAKRVPRIQHVVEKIPTPVFISAYAVGIVLLQDMKTN